MNDVLLTPRELAAVLKVSLTTVYRLVDRRAIPFHRISRKLRFSTADVDEFVKSSRVETIK